MENASRALLIAAAVLLGVMIIGIGTFLIFTFGGYAAEVEAERAETEITSFNANFLKYENADNITIHQIITLANLAIENNKRYELTNEDAGDESTYYVQVIANVKTKTSSNRKANLTLVNAAGSPILNFNEIIEENSYDVDLENRQVLYRCKKISISSITKRVYSIELERIR